jgi:hypothetical protein
MLSYKGFVGFMIGFTAIAALAASINTVFASGPAPLAPIPMYINLNDGTIAVTTISAVAEEDVVACFGDTATGRLYCLSAVEVLESEGSTYLITIPVDLESEDVRS